VFVEAQRLGQDCGGGLSHDKPILRLDGPPKQALAADGGRGDNEPPRVSRKA